VQRPFTAWSGRSSHDADINQSMRNESNPPEYDIALHMTGSETRGLASYGD